MVDSFDFTSAGARALHFPIRNLHVCSKGKSWPMSSRGNARTTDDAAIFPGLAHSSPNRSAAGADHRSLHQDFFSFSQLDSLLLQLLIKVSSIQTTNLPSHHLITEKQLTFHAPNCTP